MVFLIGNYTMLGIYTPVWAEDSHNWLFVHARRSTFFYVLYCIFQYRYFLVITKNFYNSPLVCRKSLLISSASSLSSRFRSFFLSLYSTLIHSKRLSRSHESSISTILMYIKESHNIILYKIQKESSLKSNNKTAFTQLKDTLRERDLYLLFFIYYQ